MRITLPSLRGSLAEDILPVGVVKEPPKTNSPMEWNTRHEEPVDGGDASRLLCVADFWNDVVIEFGTTPNIDLERTIMIS